MRRLLLLLLSVGVGTSTAALCKTCSVIVPGPLHQKLRVQALSSTLVRVEMEGTYNLDKNFNISSSILKKIPFLTTPHQGIFRPAVRQPCTPPCLDSVLRMCMFVFTFNNVHYAIAILFYFIIFLQFLMNLLSATIKRQDLMAGLKTGRRLRCRTGISLTARQSHTPPKWITVQLL